MEFFLVERIKVIDISVSQRQVKFMGLRLCCRFLFCLLHEKNLMCLIYSLCYAVAVFSAQPFNVCYRLFDGSGCNV